MKSFYIFLFSLFTSFYSFGQNFNLDWVISPECDNHVLIHDLAVLDDGGVVIVGGYMGTVNADVNGGSDMHSAPDQIYAFVAKYDANQNIVWWEQTFPSGLAANCEFTNVKVMDGGDILITYYAIRGNTFQGEELSVYTPNEMFGILSISANGEYQWKKQLISDDDVYGTYSQLDFVPNQGYLFTGWFTGTLDCDPSEGVANITGSNNPSFVCRLDENGAFESAFSLSANSFSIVRIKASSLLEDGSFICVGSFDGSANMNPEGDEVTVQETSNYESGFIAKYDVNNILQWVKLFPNDISYLDKVKLINEGNGNLVLTGHYYGELDFTDFTGGSLISSQGNADAFCLRMNEEAEISWLKSFGSSGVETIRDIEVKDDKVYLCGTFTSNMTLDVSTGTTVLQTSNGIDAFVYLLDKESGEGVSAYTVGATGMDSYECIGVDDMQNLYLGGILTSSDDIDFTSGVYSLVAPSPFSRSYVVKMNAGLVAIDESNVTPLEIYPNPTSDIIRVGGEFEGMSTVQVVDIMGRVIQQEIGNREIDVTQLPSGIYFLKVIDGTEEGIAKFIKQ
ncbi:MAG: T9SS type A sorting domain-containing protein [Flavobacteriales bacterium]